MSSDVLKLIKAEGKPRVWAILGPTASGKSELIAPLLQTRRFSFIGCDSVHLYKELTVGSTRPTDAELRPLHHACVATHLLSQKISAYDYAESAMGATREALAEDHHVLVCGGSGFYFESTALGLAPSVDFDLDLRGELQMQYREDPQKLYKQMERMDPKLRSKVHLNDEYRIVRALEAMILTGEKWSSLQSKRTAFRPWAGSKPFILHWEINDLRRRIENRTHLLLKKGWIEEVERLLALYPASTPGLKSVGYAQVIPYILGGKKDRLTDLESQINLATWHFARKQMTFFRSLAKKIPVKWIERKD